MITVNHLRKTYIQADGNIVEPIKDMSFHVNRGDVIAIIGPSGGGKSSLLHALNLLSPPDSGEIIVDGENIMTHNYPVEKLRQRMGMVFQNFNLFNHLTVLENIILAPMKVLGKSRNEATTEGMEMLRKVGMAERANALPSQLSGGQQQRAAIARCLAMKPDIILFDEPISALDPTMQDEVQMVIKQLAKEKLTMLIVTHKLALARDVSNRIFFIDNGIVYEEGPTELMLGNPQRPATRAFVLRWQTLVFEIESRDFDFYDMTTQIKQFCLRYTIPEKINPITHIVEEMLIMLSKYNKPVYIQVAHNELTSVTEVSVVHKGETISPFDREDADELAVMIIKGMSNGFRTEQTDKGIKLIFSV